MTDAIKTAPSGDATPTAAASAGVGHNPPATSSGAQDRPKTAAETALGSAGDAPGDATDAGAWPDDWRSQLADGDARLEKRLGRFASPRNVVDSLLAAELRLRGGQDGLRDGPPDGEDDPAALAAWRAAQGVPDAPDGYELDLKDGNVLGDDDQPIVEGFMRAAHEAHMTADQVNRAVGWYLERHDEASSELAAGDRARHDETIDALKQSWGPDFRAHVNLVHGLLDGAPAGVKENLLGARMADGALFGDSAAALTWLSDLARAANPQSALTPAGVSGTGRALNDEIAAIEDRMANDRAAYFKDEPTQARYRDLIAARDGK